MADSDNFLTDQIIRSATSREKPYTIRDGRGLFLLVHPNGSKYFQLRVTVAGVRKLVQIGVYPKISIQEARKLARAKVESLEKDAEEKSNSNAQNAFVNYPKAPDDTDTESQTLSSDDISVNQTANEIIQDMDQATTKEALSTQNSQDMFIPIKQEYPQENQYKTDSYKEKELNEPVNLLYHHNDGELSHQQPSIQHIIDEAVLVKNQVLTQSNSEIGEISNTDEDILERSMLSTPKKVPEVNLTYEQIVYRPNQRHEILGFFGKLNRLVVQKIQLLRNQFIKAFHFVRNQPTKFNVKTTKVYSRINQLSHSAKVFFASKFQSISRLKQYIFVVFNLKFISKLKKQLHLTIQQIKSLFGIKFNVVLNHINSFKNNILRVLLKLNFKFDFKFSRGTFLFQLKRFSSLIQSLLIKLLNHVIRGITYIENPIIFGIKSVQLKWTAKVSAIKYYFKVSRDLNMQANHGLSRYRMNHALEFRGNYVMTCLIIILVAITK